MKSKKCILLSLWYNTCALSITHAWMSTYFIVKMSKHDSFTEVVFTVGKLCERQTSAVCIGDKWYRPFDNLASINLVANESLCNFGQLCVRFLLRQNQMC